MYRHLFVKIRFRRKPDFKKTLGMINCKICKYTQVLCQKVEYTNFYVNIPKNTYTYIEALVFLGIYMYYIT